MRWGYLIPRIILLTIVWAFFALAFDPLLRRAVIATSQQATGGRVEIGELQTAFFPPALSLADVRVGNPQAPSANLFEFENLQMDLAGRPFLKKSYIVREARLTGLQFGTTRDDSGRALRSWDLPLPGREALERLGHAAGEAGEQWLDVLAGRALEQLDPQQLESVRVADERRRQWQDRFKKLESRAQRLKTRVGTVRTAVDRKRNALEQVAAYQQAAQDVNSLLRELKQIRAEMQRMPATAERDLRDIDAARRRDLAAVNQKLKAVRLDPATISEALLGPELAGRAARTLGWIRWFEQRVGALADDLEPDRMRGLDFEFARKPPLPKYLIETLHIAGETEFGGEILSLTGTIQGVTTEPAVYGKPTKLELAADGEAQLSISGQLDHSGSTPIRNVRIRYTIPKRNETTLGDPRRPVVTVAADQTVWNIQCRIAGDELDGTVTLRQEPVRLRAGGGAVGRDSAALLDSVLRGVTRVEATVRLSGTVDDPRWTLTSNLGPELAAGLNAAVRGEVDRHRQIAAAQIDAAAKQQTDAFRDLLRTRYGGLTADLNLSETEAQQLIRRVAGRSFDFNRLLRR